MNATWFKRLQRAGIDSFAGRNGARLALAVDLPASVLAELTGLHITTALRWTTWAKRDRTAFVATRGSYEPTNAESNGREPRTRERR